MAKDKKLFSKILLIFLMIMIAAGFTIPMLDFEDKVYAVEPRVCQQDSDCYLVCGDTPLKVFCSQNIQKIRIITVHMAQQVFLNGLLRHMLLIFWTNQ